MLLYLKVGSVRDMNVMIFLVCAMECMCAQTRPQFILSSERVLGGMESEPMIPPREKSPLHCPGPHITTEPLQWSDTHKVTKQNLQNQENVSVEPRVKRGNKLLHCLLQV